MARVTENKCFWLKHISSPLPMITPNSKSYYIAAIIIGLAVGLAARDMPIGILLAVVLMILFSGLRKKNE